jgi:hypothetical protein
MIKDSVIKSYFHKLHIFFFLIGINFFFCKECLAVKSVGHLRILEDQLEQHELSTGHQAVHLQRDLPHTLNFPGNLSQEKNCPICNEYLKHIEKLHRLFGADSLEETDPEDKV